MKRIYMMYRQAEGYTDSGINATEGKGEATSALDPEFVENM